MGCRGDIGRLTVTDPGEELRTMKRVIKLGAVAGEVTVGWLFGRVTVELKAGPIRLDFGLDNEGTIELRDALSAALADAATDDVHAAKEPK